MNPRRSPFVEGLLAPWEGLFWLVRRPQAWGLALVPTAIGLVLLVVLSAAGIGVVEHLLRDLHPGTSTSGLLGFLAHLVGWLVALALALVVALALAQPLSGTALEALAGRREQELGVPKRPESSAAASIFRSLRVTVFGLVCTLPLIVALAVLTLFFPAAAVVTVPLKLVLTCTMLAWDIVDYPLSLRSAGVRARLAWFGAHFPAALGMGVGLAVMFCIPGAQLVLIGAGVAGATKLVTDLEAAHR